MYARIFLAEKIRAEKLAIELMEVANGDVLVDGVTEGFKIGKSSPNTMKLLASRRLPLSKSVTVRARSYCTGVRSRNCHA